MPQIFHWACGIAFNEVRNFLTVQRRNRLQFDLELVELLAQEAAEEESVSESRLEALRRCLSQLSERQQAILQQCYPAPSRSPPSLSNWGANEPPSTNNGTAAPAPTGFKSLRITLGTGSATHVDELRISTSWSAVVPQPRTDEAFLSLMLPPPLNASYRSGFILP